VPGDDFYLRLDRPSASHPMPASQERSLAIWYDLMKSNLHLEATQSPYITLQPRETLYLVSQAVELWTAADDPLTAGKTDNPPGKVSPSDEDLTMLYGRGQLFLTNQRLAWQGETSSHDFHLTRLQGAYAILTLGLAVSVGMRLVFFQFLHESPLKWTSYIDLVAAQEQVEIGRRIETSHW